MKIIGESLRKVNKRLPEPVQRMLDSLSSDPDWLREMEAQEAFVNQLQGIFDDKYVLVWNAQLKGLELPIPLILVGPPGIWLFQTSALRGFYRAIGEQWEKLHDRIKGYRSEHNNLISQLNEIYSVLKQYLTERGYQNVKTEPVLIFTDPGMHVEFNSPVVRIILVDALERFLANIVKSPSIIGLKESQALISYLAEDGAIELEQQPELIIDEFAFTDDRKQPVQLPEMPISYPDDARILKAMRKVPFSSSQIIFLGIMVIINILIVVIFLIMVLYNP